MEEIKYIPRIFFLWYSMYETVVSAEAATKKSERGNRTKEGQIFTQLFPDGMVALARVLSPG